MGPGILVALGVLLLLQDFWYIGADEIFPILLILIGLLLIGAHNVSTEGHVQPRWARGGPLEPGAEEKDPSQTGGEPQVKL